MHPVASAAFSPADATDVDRVGTGDEFFDVGVVELPDAKLSFPLECLREFNRELRSFWTR
jgi:hypothetical protein